jgi:hypothetical protein
MMRGVFESVTWPLRQLAWKIDEKVVWPVVDTVDELQYRFLGDGTPEISAPTPRWRRYGPELLAVGVLVVVAFLARRHSVPTDGLWLDDADPGAAAKASLSQLHMVSEGQPGFVAALIGLSRLTGGNSDSFAYPAFVAGTLGPALLYLALRKFGYERSVSALMGAALAAAQTHIVNSGRVRTFTTDLLIVLGLALVLPRLTRMRWSWKMGVAWIAVGVVVASLSGFALGAIAVAGVIVLLHPASDLRVRAVAVGAQGAAALALLLVQSNTYNTAKIDSQYRHIWDAFPDFHLNPLRLGGDLLLHLRRLAEVFPGGAHWLAMLCGLAAVAGIAAACLRGRQAIAARYLGLVLAATVVGSLLGKVPFGPKQTSPLDNGYRVSLWLVPVVAVGLAVVFQGLRRVLADRRLLRIGFDTAAYAAAAAILVSALAADQPPYPFPGAKSAAHLIESQVGKRDAVLIPFHAEWSFTTETSFSPNFTATPQQTEGYDPLSWDDRRIHYVGLDVDAPHVRGFVKNAKRVFVYYPALLVGGLLPPESKTRTMLTSTLRSLGFERQRAVTYQDAKVDIFKPTHVRGKPGANPQAKPHKPQAKPHKPQAKRQSGAGGQRLSLSQISQINLRLSDLPQGWQRLEYSLGNPFTRRVSTCLHVSEPTTPSVVTAALAAGRSRLFATSEVSRWTSTAAARNAYGALRGSDGARCVRSAEISTLRSASLPSSVTIKMIPPPPTGGYPALAYRATIRGPFHLDHGTIVFFSRGATGVLISSFNLGPTPFPSHLFSSLVAVVAGRLNAATPQGK